MYGKQNIKFGHLRSQKFIAESGQRMLHTNTNVSKTSLHKGTPVSFYFPKYFFLGKRLMSEKRGTKQCRNITSVLPIAG
jgi:hypothetical protein